MSSESCEPKREAIIEGATRMFLKHGFHQVSMDRIAKEAPVSKATLYQHFENKNALFSAVISELCRSLLDTMTEITPESNELDKNLRQIAEAFIDLIYTEEALAIYRLVISECRDFPELGQVVYDSAPKIALTQLEHYLHNLKSSGHIDIPDIKFSADAFFSLLKGDLHFQCLLGISAPPSPEQKRLLIDQVIEFYLRGVLNATD
ncbi:TetR/AcrR family transcriptional regulator [Methylotuvimicrobium alcaliphilum]|uniref:Transcriptional regulator, TetR family n=1 Tax=Methylotuvimicrobium alcaliphilum (strain DSM 19304 / NCIMB 14124 / VKM B-2133 / 20Z) TaxID=1091494 RepID=G4SVN3_META2|nr:TetR/AcrR family transcriptional regulator [Methylotuvimicrobium alcaliphilum]CCE24092.1 Transcriptional regulator, TetR family [Methylotuvimicrobium alcaliphilum 20Z]